MDHNSATKYQPGDCVHANNTLCQVYKILDSFTLRVYFIKKGMLVWEDIHESNVVLISKVGSVVDRFTRGVPHVSAVRT